MKKMTLVACAAMLASAALLPSCKKESQNEPTKPAETVKTEFSIALPSQLSSNGARRMPGTTVQKGGRSQFQGMKGITLVPFTKQSAIEGSDTRLGANITLGDIENAEALGTNSNAKVYSNIAIPLTTASFLFYAESKKDATEFEKGVLTAAKLNHNNPSDFEFNLSAITTVSAAHSDAKAVALLAYLNSIAKATDDTKAWRKYETTDDAGMAALFATYASAHTLSSFGVQRMVQNLYNSMVPLSSTLATNIKAAIAASATVTAPVAPETEYTVELNSDLQGYPANLKLPQGAVHIKWDGTLDTDGAFRVLSESEYAEANYVLPSMYTYPSSLWYTANSRINTSNSSKKDEYNDTDNWATILGKHGDARAVNSLTRAVAITDPIQYAVARLDVQVKLDATTLEDNTPVHAQEIACASYPITGILVGGQKNVGFNFQPNGTNVYTIYDNVMTNTSMTATSAYDDAMTNSTLVLETEAGQAPTNKDVRIAVEFTNASGKDFIGADGQLIPAGGKFYVVGVLASNAATETGYKVFKQDYTTTAKLNLTSLKNAYNTIPDLRTPELEIGFSVNLSWEEGHTYEDIVL